MTFRSTFAVFFCVSFAYVFFLTNNSTFGQLDQNTTRFVGDVLVGTEFGAKQDQVSMRWVTQPRLSTFGPGSHHSSVVENVVRQLNKCLPTDAQIQIVSPNDETASLKVYFVPFRQFADVADKHGFQNLSNNWGYFNVRWNEHYQLKKSIVLIADDKLRGNRLAHFVLEEITQSMGLAGDSTRFRDSVFYEDMDDKRQIGRYGTATTLTKLDKRLIRFLYNHVPTGSHPVEIGVLLARHW